MLQTIIEKQHSKYSPAQISQLRTSLLRMHDAFQGRFMVATGCSGTDLLILVVQKLLRFWHVKFGIDFELQHLWSCDKAAGPQAFIRAHFAPQALIDKNRRRNTKQRKHKTIPLHHRLCSMIWKRLAAETWLSTSSRAPTSKWRARTFSPPASSATPCLVSTARAVLPKESCKLDRARQGSRR